MSHDSPDIGRGETDARRSSSRKGRRAAAQEPIPYTFRTHRFDGDPELEECRIRRWQYLFSLSILPASAGWSRPVLAEPDWLELSDPANECVKHGRLPGDDGSACGCWDPAVETAARQRFGGANKSNVVELYPRPEVPVRDVRKRAARG
jgi:hypothetical protein